MAGQGLSTDEVQGIREALAAGRKPRVVFTEAAGQIAGQIGQVVELTDPEASEEFVVVRFGRDELPFSPADVAVAPKGAGRRPAAEANELLPAGQHLAAQQPAVPEPLVDAPLGA
ncbi:hypothetical protein AB0B62_28265, partial [Micromonospora chalcea]